MAKPLPRIDDVVARVKTLAAQEATKVASTSAPVFETELAKELSKLASVVRAEASSGVSVQDVLDFAQQVSR
jgi:hypothetical protein